MQAKIIAAILAILSAKAVVAIINILAAMGRHHQQ